MPEAPEVEAVVRAIRPLLKSRTIKSARVVHPIATRPQSARSLAREVSDQRIIEVSRHGKYLIVELSRGVLVMHFKFDGQLFYFDAAPPRGTHIDVLFQLDHGLLGFVDPRHLGRVLFHANRGDSQALRSLGIDVFSPAFAFACLVQLLAKSRVPVKIALMDQSRLAGLGNIYASESLWRAGLSPRSISRSLSQTEIRRLHKAIVYVIHRALECCSDPPPDFRSANWWFADLDKLLRVYSREGEPCRRCGAKIRRIEQAGRSTFFCPHCQR